MDFMDFSKLSRSEWLGLVASALLVIAVLFLPWFDLAGNPARDMGTGFLCGQGEFSCTGFETFPILRWLLLAAALAPWILAYIVVRGHKLSWPPGELTMVVGFTAFVLIGYNGIVDQPGSGQRGDRDHQGDRLLRRASGSARNRRGRNRSGHGDGQGRASQGTGYGLT